MAKKIYDIMPPKVAYKKESVAMNKKQPSKKGRTLQSKERMPASRPTEGKTRRFPLKEILIGGGIIVLLLGVYFYNTLPKADIQIWPALQTLSLQEKITANKSANAIDVANKIIPAQYAEEQKDGFQEFTATGSASNDGKATGTITVYNKITPANSFTLKTGTHFLSDSGKYFVTTTKIVIPAAKGGSPGSVDVKVQAEESGTDYNVTASKFSVPKLSGTAYYYGIWGESTTAMAGGYTGNVKKVTDDDIKSAQDSLTQKLLQDAEASLRQKLGADDVLLDGGIVRTIVDSSSAVKSGAILDKFNVQATVKVSALVFKKSDLEQLIKNDFNAQLADGENVLEKSVHTSYTADPVDMQKGVESINLQSSVQKYYGINPNDLIDAVSQKSSDQIQQTIAQKYGDKVSQTKIDFWPFWVHASPSNKNRININLNFQ